MFVDTLAQEFPQQAPDLLVSTIGTFANRIAPQIPARRFRPHK
jgi:hypothetical protein